MDYILCEFYYGYSGRFFQASSNGQVVGLYDLDGNLLTLPEGIPYGYVVIEDNPIKPNWAN